jgi:hypothetical protein
MDRPDYPEADKPGTPTVPALIHDYRAQREAWREQARNLARMREEVLQAADREAKDIVTAARTEVRRILLKARRDLLVLAAQVRAAGRLGEPEDAPEAGNFLPADDLGDVRGALTTARQDVRRVLDETRPELEGLAAEGQALRAALRPHRPTGPMEFPRQIPSHSAFADPEENQGPVDFEFTSIATDDPEEPFVHTRFRRPVRAFVAMVASFGAIAVMGTAWWVYRSPDAKQTAISDSPKNTSKAAATKTAPAADVTAAPLSGTPVNITAKREAWMRVNVDGRTVTERTFRAGETQQVRATREVSVRAGDAGAVTVSVAGRQPVALGPEGEVVTRRFGVEAPRAPAPAPPTTAPGPQPPASAGSSQPVRRPSVPSLAELRPPSPTARPLDQSVVLPTAAPQPSPSVPPAAATAGVGSQVTVIERPAALTTSANPASLQDSLVRDATRWLDAYYRQDKASMAAVSSSPVNVSDDRPDKEKLPRGLAGVRRSLEDVNVQVFGPEAMLTAKMTERMDDAGRMASSVAFVSHMWTQRNGVWQLHDVRIVSAATLSRTTAR